MSGRITKIIASVLGLAIFGFVLYQFLLLVMASAFASRAYDVSRRLSSPDGTKTALLVRDYAFDLNFKLFIVDGPYDPPPKPDSYLWSSHDYNPETEQNFHEDLEWSQDSSVIAVIIDGEYVFAYDFKPDEKVEDQELIKQLLKSRNSP